MPQHVYVALDPDGDLIAVSTDIDGLHAPIFRWVDIPDEPIGTIVLPAADAPDLATVSGAPVLDDDGVAAMMIATVRRVDLYGS